MLITLQEAKAYLRVDTSDDDGVIENILSSAHRLCLDTLRTDDPVVLENEPNAKVAVLYAVAYIYEHREEADYCGLAVSLRALLSGSRKEVF